MYSPRIEQGVQVDRKMRTRPFNNYKAIRGKKLYSSGEVRPNSRRDWRKWIRWLSFKGDSEELNQLVQSRVLPGSTSGWHEFCKVVVADGEVLGGDTKLAFQDKKED